MSAKREVSRLDGPDLAAMNQVLERNGFRPADFFGHVVSSWRLGMSPDGPFCYRELWVVRQDPDGPGQWPAKLWLPFEATAAAEVERLLKLGYFGPPDRFWR